MAPQLFHRAKNGYAPGTVADPPTIREVWSICTEAKHGTSAGKATIDFKTETLLIIRWDYLDTPKILIYSKSFCGRTIAVALFASKVCLVGRMERCQCSSVNLIPWEKGTYNFQSAHFFLLRVSLSEVISYFFHSTIVMSGSCRPFPYGCENL